MLCTSGFVDDVMFLNEGQMGQNQARRYISKKFVRWWYQLDVKWVALSVLWSDSDRRSLPATNQTGRLNLFNSDNQIGVSHGELRHFTARSLPLDSDEMRSDAMPWVIWTPVNVHSGVVVVVVAKLKFHGNDTDTVTDTEIRDAPIV